MADLYLADGACLHLEDDWRTGLGWWRADGPGRQRLTVAQALELAPAGVGHEVLLEAQHLAYTALRECLGEGSQIPARHQAIAALNREIHAAMMSLAASPGMQAFGQGLEDRMVR